MALVFFITVLMCTGLVLVIGLAKYQEGRIKLIEDLYRAEMKRNADKAVKDITNLKKKHTDELDDAVKTLQSDIKVLDEENTKFRNFAEKMVAERDRLAKELHDFKAKEDRRKFGIINSLLGAVREIDEKIFDELVSGDETEDEIG